MMKINKLHLTQKEDNFLLKFEKNAQKNYLNYISVGLSLVTAIVGLIIGIAFDSKGGYLIALIAIGVCINWILLIHFTKRLYSIITKMKQHIENLEKNSK